MRLLLPLLLLCSACATVPTSRGADPLPCTDDDAPRCLRFLVLLDRDATEVDEALERYCVSGRSDEACQRLAGRRHDLTLEGLCRDGVQEACPLPADSARSLEALRQDCLARVPGTCRALGRKVRQRGGARVSQSELLDAPLFEAACGQGVAEACYGLSTVLAEGSGVARNPERARTLAWRACLAGVKEACAASEVGAEKCAQGQSKACAPFDFQRDDSPERRARKAKVLIAACEHHDVRACTSLVHAEVLPAARALERVCDVERDCDNLLAALGREVKLATCRDGHGPARDHACLLSVTGRRQKSQQLEDEPSEPGAWAEAACTAGRVEACEALALRELDFGHRYDAKARACRLNLSICTEIDRRALANFEACRATKAVPACFAAASWLEGGSGVGRQWSDLSSYDRDRALQAYETACTGREAAACLRAAALLDQLPRLDRRVALLRQACTLGAKEACTAVAPLERAQAACAQGSCVEWYRAVAQSGLPLAEALVVLEGPCLRGSMADCVAWRDVSRHDWGFLLPTCAAQPKLCGPETTVPVALWKACTGGQSKACVELGATVPTDWEAGTSAETRRAWATRACDAGDAVGCGQLADTWAIDAEQWGPAAEKACAAGHAETCVQLARALWDQVLGDRRHALELKADPRVKRSAELVGKACAQGVAEGCALAADFAEGDLLGAPDPLAAERLRLRGRELKLQQAQRSPGR